MFVSMYVVACSVCRLEHTYSRSARAHQQRPLLHRTLTRHMSTKSSTATKKRLEKPGQLLAQRFKLASCIDRVGVATTACSYAVAWYNADNMH